ncbi:MAG: hypothetical protein ACP5KI_03125 [Brevinematia bacterium]
MIEKMLRRLFIASFTMVFSFCAFSDVVILKDNSVLRGQVVSNEGNIITFKLFNGKMIRLKNSDIAVIEFGASEVVEFVENGRKFRGVVVSENDGEVIVRTALGDKVIKKENIKKYSSIIKNEVYLTNYYTNFVTNVIYETNSYFITNYLTNHFNEFESDISYVNKSQSLRKYLKVGLGALYDFQNTFLVYFGGLDFSIGNLNFDITVGSFNKLFATLGVSYCFFGWLNSGVSLGGSWGSGYGYLFSFFLSPFFEVYKGNFEAIASLIFIDLKPSLMFTLGYNFIF